MDHLSQDFNHNPKYTRLRKPLQAARVCDAARSLAQGRFEIISFKDGLLTVGVKSPTHAQEIQMNSMIIIDEINKKLEQNLVKNLRYKII